MSRKNIDMLNGSIADKILYYAIPLALTGMLQQLFQTADLAVVGQFAGKNAMAAVGSNTPIIGLLINLFIGISIGANVVIARYTGENDPDGIKKGVHTAFLFAIISGCTVAVIGELLIPFFLRILYVPAEIFGLSQIYLRIYMIGVPVIFLYNFESAIYRSQGDTKTPLYCLLFSGLLNLLLNLLFVCVLNMSVSGVALATVISNVVCAGLLLYFLLRRTDLIRLEPKMLHIDRLVLWQIIQIGLPAGMQNAMFAISNMVVQSAINSLGADVMAADAAAFNVEIMCSFVVNAFGQACTTFVGQNYGAKNFPRCRKITRVSLLLDLVGTAMMSAFIIAIGPKALSLFNTNDVIIATGMIRVRIVLTTQSLCVLIDIISGAMRAYGHSLTPALTMLVGVCGVRIVWIYTIFRQYPSYFTLMIIYPITWTIAGSFLVYSYVKLHASLDV